MRECIIKEAGMICVWHLHINGGKKPFSTESDI